MVCPVYREKNECGLHSEFYELLQETIDQYCKNDYFYCKEFLENNKKALEKIISGPDFSWLKNISHYIPEKH